MSISYQPKDAAVQGLQLKVQELVVMKADSGIYSDDGTDCLIDIKQELLEIRAVLFSNPGVALSSRVATIDSGKKIKVAGLVLGADDALIIKFIAK